MTPNQQSLLTLLERAKQEGIDETLARQASAEAQPSPADNRPVHNIVNPLVDYYFKLLPANGYKYSDVSRMWYFTKYVSESSRKNMADRSNPFLVFSRDGDHLLLESEGLPSQTILPTNNVYECYPPSRPWCWRTRWRASSRPSASFG